MLTEIPDCLGGDPRGFAAFIELRDELAKLNHPACPDVDWAKAEQLCLRLFLENGAELQTAVSFALIQSRRSGLAGMTQGVASIQALVATHWAGLWPPMAPMRMEILTWLCAQWQPLLRALDTSTYTVVDLGRLDTELERLVTQLDGQGQQPPAALQALRVQVNSLMQRLERSVSSGDVLPIPATVSEPACVVPVMLVPARPIPEVPPTASIPRKRPLALWLFGLAAIIALACGFWWWSHLSGQSTQPQPGIATPVSLDSLSLFEAGRTELKPDSTKVLINALINIRAQPGWLIVIVGHTDTTGDTAQNLRLSYARASAVRSWMQRMGDIPDNCFVVRGMGGEQPIASDDTASGRAANRRVEIQLMPQVEACAQSSSQ